MGAFRLALARLTAGGLLFLCGAAAAQEAGPAVPLADQLGFANPRGALLLEPGTTLCVKKLLPSDCRMVRVFIPNPIDGRLDSRHYGNSIVEFPRGGAEGAAYEYNGGDGIHIRLADRRGFDAVLIRGGYQGRMYRDVNALDGPGTNGALICAAASEGNVFRARLDRRVESGTVSFFQRGGEFRGKLSDVSFLRLSHGDFPAPEHSLGIGRTAPLDPKVAEWMGIRFGAGQVVVQAGEAMAGTLPLRANEFTHVLTPPLDATRGLAAVGLRFRTAGACLLTVRVQDPLDARRELMGADFAVPRAGDYRVVMDIPDQVLLPPENEWAARPLLEGPLCPAGMLWVSLAADAAGPLEGVRLEIHHAPRETCLPEALAWRKLLLKGVFYTNSEPHPWTNMTGGRGIRSFTRRTDTYGRFNAGLEETLETVEVCRLLAPQDDIVRQYYEWIYGTVGRFPSWTPRIPDAPGAPRWAQRVHAGYQAARAVPLWWMANRCVPTGEMGGGVGDDTDLYQTWSSFPLIEDRPLGEQLKDGARRLAEQAVATRLEGGINRRRTDSLHAYEEGTNHLGLCAWWFYGDPVHYERVMEATASVRKLTVPGFDGKRWFFSQWYSSADLRAHSTKGKGSETVGSDGGGNHLFFHPVYEAAWYNLNPSALAFLTERADSWLSLQKAPDGWAATVNVKTGEVLRTQYRPGYIGYGGAAATWSGAAQITGDGRFLRAYEMALANLPRNARKEQYWEDSATHPAFAAHLDKLRASDPAQSNGYLRFVLTGDKKLLERDLEAVIAKYQRFQHMYTEAEPYTDRVYTEVGPVALCYLGSFITRNRWAQNHAVSYEGFGPDFAALVYSCGPDKLRVALFNFADGPREGVVRVWRLDHGRYEVRFGPDADDNGAPDTVERRETLELQRHAPIALTLPPGKLMALDVSLVEKLDDIRLRADLALSPLDTKLVHGALHVVVHNIGSRPAANVQVALVRGAERVAEQTLDAIDAPIDLLPRTARLTFQEARAGDAVVIDPDGLIPEVAEHNNRLVVP